MNRRQFLLFSTVVTTSFLLGCSEKSSHQKIARGSTVIALGDSLTFGYGASSETAYPVVLAKKTGWNIINEGINGDTSAGVLKRLDGIIEQNPKLVLLGIGGNDVLQRVNSSVTTENITKTVQQLKKSSIPVVLIAEPHFSASALFGKASDNPIYEQIAESEKVPAFLNGWSEILSDNSLKSDQIHANAQGYAKFAEMLYEFLQEQGFA